MLRIIRWTKCPVKNGGVLGGGMFNTVETLVNRCGGPGSHGVTGTNSGSCRRQGRCPAHVCRCSAFCDLPNQRAASLPGATAAGAWG